MVKKEGDEGKKRKEKRNNVRKNETIIFANNHDPSIRGGK